MDFNKGNRNPLLLMDIQYPWVSKLVIPAHANRTHFQTLDLSGEFLKIGNEKTQELADRRRQKQSKTILIVIDVYEINHKRTAEMKSNEEFPRSGT